MLISEQNEEIRIAIGNDAMRMIFRQTGDNIVVDSKTENEKTGMPDRKWHSPFTTHYSPA